MPRIVRTHGVLLLRDFFVTRRTSGLDSSFELTTGYFSFSRKDLKKPEAWGQVTLPGGIKTPVDMHEI